MAVDPTPGQTAITLKTVAGLSGNFEFGGVWTGQSNSRPWGYPVDGFDFAPELELEKTGLDLVNVVIPNNGGRIVGTVEVVSVTGTFLAANEWNTSTFLRLGTTSAPRKGYAEVISNGVTTLVVKWISLPDNNVTVPNGYLVRENGKWASYEQVRVLTPFIPSKDIEAPPFGGGSTWAAPLHSPYPTPNAAFASGGQRLILPAPFTLPAAVTTFDDLALFLPLSKKEGIDGFGLSEMADSSFAGIGAPTSHAITAIAGNTWTFANAISVDADLTGGYLLVDWEDAGATKRSWSRLASSTSTTFVTTGVWLGDGDIGAGNHTKVKRYTAWVPHWRDNPYMWVPGPEFGYPNEDQQPIQPIHNRPRGRLLYVTSNAPGGNPFLPFDGVGDARFGAMLPFGYRLSGAMGKRINMIALGFNSASLAPAPIPNFFAYPGILGWWNYEMFAFALSMEDSNSALSKRLKRLITFIGPQALLAENNSKPLRFVSACHVQGESDSLRDGGRELYLATITDYKEWLRDLITDAGLSPFQAPAKMPFAQPLLTRDPWEIDAPGGTYQGGGADTEGLLNNAMRDAHTSDEFAAYTLTEDIPKLKYQNGQIDTAHFSGQGMAVQGARLAAVILDLMEHAFAHGSDSLDSTHPRLLRIANLAMIYIGENSTQITSLTEQTTVARLINAMLPEARNQLLSMKQWSWAVRREPASQVHHRNPHWLYAYVVPGRAAHVFKITPPTASEDEVDPTHLTGSILPPAITGDVEPKSEPFVVERSPSGHRLLFTNVPETPGDVRERTVADAVLHPERLPRRPTLHYVDKVVDPDRYSDSFASALSWLLASMLAPALIKGEKGEAVATRCLQKCAGFLRTGATNETVQRQQTPTHIPSFMADR